MSAAPIQVPMRAILAFLLLVPSVAAHAADRQPPYWASVSANKASLRTGPAKNYPILYVYKRPDLPIRVVATYPGWRKVREPDGTTGWMSVRLLSAARTAIVTNGFVRPLRRSARDDARVVGRVAPGVVGRLSDCGGSWCRLTVNGRSGFLRTADLWGVDANEAFD